MSVQREAGVAAASGASPASAVTVSVVIPCLNEAHTISACVSDARRAFAELGVGGEVIVADNGSTDGSAELAEAAGGRIVRVGARGYGNALIGGIASARGRYVVMGDGDGSYDFTRLGDFVAKLQDGYDFVIGNRFRGGIDAEAMPWLHEHVGNPLLSLLSRRLYGTPCGDIYCGLRAFRKESVQALDLRAGGMEFAIEMVVKAKLQGMRIAEVPTTLSPDGRGRPAHLRTWRDGWRSLRLLLLYSPTWLFLYPGLAGMTLGLAAIIVLLPRQRTIGHVTFDAHTLVYAALAVVVGYQSVVFFVLARTFAITEGLLPASERVLRRLGRLRLEIGLVVGTLCVLGGIAGSLAAVGAWESKSFGRLDYPTILRIVVPSSMLITLGLQTVLASFFLSILRMRRH